MATSIILLVVLQGLWLRSSYRDAEEDFRKETNAIFRSVVLAMHDSLIQRNLKAVPGDSLFTYRGSRKYHFKEFDTRIDSIFVKGEAAHLREKTTRIEIVTSSIGSDSITHLLRPLTGRIRADDEPKTFILRLGRDSLTVDSIAMNYHQALSQAGIEATFNVIALRDEPGSKHRGPKRIDFRPDVVRINPINNYAVSFDGTNKLILAEIAPQIVFAVFVSLLTLVSFYVMYANLRSQQKLMQVKNDFISNITHELKTPVATVSVALEALRSFKALDDPQRTAEYLDIAQNELDRLTLMTDKILKTAVFENRGLDVKIEQMDLDSLVQQVLSSMKLVFEKRKTKVSFHKTGTDFNVEASHAHLTNVLYNLIDNALKYSPPDSSLDIGLNAGPDHVNFSIRDRGIGIPSEYHKKIFDKFFRVPAGDVHNTKGYGLGLSYVASVVKNHRGTISVESEPGKGSCFSVTLPKKYEGKNSLR